MNEKDYSEIWPDKIHIFGVSNQNQNEFSFI